MNEDDDLGVDLHVWRVPPPVELDRASLVMRALAPVTAAARRPRLRWIVAAIILINAAIAALLVIGLARPPAAPAPTVALPAGAPAVDPALADVQRELARSLYEIEDLRALVLDLSAKIQRLEPDRTVPKHAEACDEVSCVLDNHRGACCAKYLPEALDRAAISSGIGRVKADLTECGSAARGKVSVHVNVAGSGAVTQVTVLSTPDAALGACVEAAVRRASFPRTKTGGSFSYPFVF